MVIIIGNQKGGAGKSTLTLMLANYLSSLHSCNVTVLDMDYQQSIAQKYEKAKLLENIPPYEVIAASLEDYPVMQTVLAANSHDMVLVDLPGKLDDDGLIPLFQYADLILCPFAYDEFSFNSTVLFSVVIKQINPAAIIHYVPNRIKANVRYELQTEVNQQLSKFGEITPAIPDRIDFSRTTTFRTPETVLPVVIPVFELLYQKHFSFLTAERHE